MINLIIDEVGGRDHRGIEQAIGLLEIGVCSEAARAQYSTHYSIGGDFNAGGAKRTYRLCEFFC
jgi:hypothetical protein